MDLTGLELDAASRGEELKNGDLILIGFFYRGSGQQLSGGGPWKIMPGQTYVANYLIPEGADAITGYWNKHILADEELLELVKINGAEVGGSIFEDSIELHTYGAPWGKGFEKYVPEKMGYPIGDYLPVLAGFATDNQRETMRITQDFASPSASCIRRTMWSGSRPGPEPSTITSALRRILWAAWESWKLRWRRT